MHNEPPHSGRSDVGSSRDKEVGGRRVRVRLRRVGSSVASQVPAAPYVSVDSSGLPSAESDRYSASRLMPRFARKLGHSTRPCDVTERCSEYAGVIFSGGGFQVRGDICFIAQIFGRIEPSHAESARDLRLIFVLIIDFLAFFARSADLSSLAILVARATSFACVDLSPPPSMRYTF